MLTVQRIKGATFLLGRVRSLALAAATVLTMSLFAMPGFAGVLLSTNSTDNSSPVGATSFLNFNNAGSATTYAAGFGYTLTRDGGSGIFQQSGSFYSPTANGSNVAVFYAQPNAADGAFYGVGGVVNGVQSYATFMGTQALSSVSVYLGSLNSFNQIALLDQSGNVISTYNGTQIDGGVNPDSTQPALTAIFTGNQSTVFYGISFSDIGNNSAFEFDNLAFTAAPTATAAPEPSSWAIMLLGIIIIVSIRRRQIYMNRAGIAEAI